MASILTNIGAMSALQTLRHISFQMGETQNQVSSGLRVGRAADNAAYWSIATTMRSDNGALSAVQDALGLGAAKVDTAYAGITAVVDVLSDFKAKLVAASEDGVDKTKIQDELDQLKQHVVGIAEASSFSGENWLNTDIEDIYDKDYNKVSVISSFVRDGKGVSVKTMNLHLSDIALFNSTNGGLLQKDARDLKTIAGIRELWTVKDKQVWYPATNSGEEGRVTFDFVGPLEFDDPSDEIRFNVTVDADNPADGLPGAQNPGSTSGDIVINRSLLEDRRPGWNGVISSYTQYAEILNIALAGTGARALTYTDGDGRPIINKVGIHTNENRSLGLDGSYIEISNLSNTVSTGGLKNDSDFGRRGSILTLDFKPLIVYQDDENGIEASFNFAINGAASKAYSFDRTYINDLLGKDDGKVATADEMVTLLQSLIQADWPTLVIEATPAGDVLLKSDVAQDRRSGSDTRLYFSNVVVSNEPLPTMNFQDIDIAENPGMITDYIDYMEIASMRVVSAAATLGALQSRIEMQAEFASILSDSIEQGIGRLVDADMNEASTRLKALETQEQLAIQSLSIANTNSENIVSLFR